MDYSDIAEFFQNNKFQWRNKKQEWFYPTADDIERVVDGAIKQLNESDDLNAQLEVGHLIIQKNGTHFDLYVHYGEV